MFAIVVSVICLFAGISLLILYHLSAMGRYFQGDPVAIEIRTARLETLLAEVENPAHIELAEKDPDYAREFLLYAFDSIEHDLRQLLRCGASVDLLPQFLLFRFYLTLFRVKTRFRANVLDIRYLMGYETYLAKRII